MRLHRTIACVAFRGGYLRMDYAFGGVLCAYTFKCKGCSESTLERHSIGHIIENEVIQ